ncbi:MAG TPA: ATP-binding cassette domain-containing protein [Solirubrobacterales bacterium]|nr:ATP-binding cassette domain-containing protein [Solirubrobacterales bacterium]
MSELAIRRGAAPALAVEGLSYAYPHASASQLHAAASSRVPAPPRGTASAEASRQSALALEDVSLQIAPGEFVLLAGRSASGKSTLLKAACGLVPHFHGGEIEGEVRVADLDALAAGPGELAAAVGYLAQDPETQVVSTTVAAEIELPLEMRGDAPADRARAVEEVALALAIPRLLDRAVDTLSGGELQRVALAAALVTRPRLILLDEPTSQLDPVAGDELIWLLRRLNEEWGVAVLLAEHRLERCLAAADRVVAMEGGRIGFDGPPSEFLRWSGESDPALTTPAARLFSLAGLTPLPVGVRDARQTLRGTGIGHPPHQASRSVPDPRPQAPVLEAKGLWVELGEGDEAHDALRGIDLQLRPGERVALMGRNGAGKSTLLRTAAGLHRPVSGKIKVDSIALLTQNPGDYLVRERVGDELPGELGLAALRAVGLEYAVDADPRDLSGGERQRLALAITLAGRMEGVQLPGVVALDEPTRGMDHARKRDLVALISQLGGRVELVTHEGTKATRGAPPRPAAVVVATHDVEFASEFAERVVLLGDGVVIADGPMAEILSGGWYFATEVARVLDLPGVVTAEQGAAVLRGETG